MIKSVNKVPGTLSDAIHYVSGDTELSRRFDMLFRANLSYSGRFKSYIKKICDYNGLRRHLRARNVKKNRFNFVNYMKIYSNWTPRSGRVSNTRCEILTLHITLQRFYFNVHYK